jgi:hypothetical protein
MDSKLLVVLFCIPSLIPFGATLPLSSVQGIYLTPNNIRYFASYLHPSADIQDRLTYFGPGVANEMILEVPLGEVEPRSTIVISVGLNKSHLNLQDYDIAIGISDGINNNLHAILDLHNYETYPPCYPRDHASHDNNILPAGTPVPPTFRLTFIPFYKYGACETAQEGGYINTGTFNAQIDTSKPLFLRAFRNDATEEYYIHYLKVEVYPN